MKKYRLLLKKAAAVLISAAAISAFAGQTASAVNRNPLGTAQNGSRSSQQSSTWKAQLSDYNSEMHNPVKYEYTKTDNSLDALLDEYQYTEITDGYAADSVLAFSDSASFASDGYAPVSAVSSTPADTFSFTTYGWGHGVGMSQHGANFYAYYAGWDYINILFHYYPYTTLMKTSLPSEITVGNMTGSVLDVISGVVYNEMGTMSYEALKAQAVAAYTYIMYFGGTARDLRTRANPPAEVVSAVSEVLGQCLYYNGSYALTFFCASTGGATASCSDIFVMDLPYLRSVPSDYDVYDPHYGTVAQMTVDEVRSRIESAYGITLSDDVSDWIKISLGSGGYADRVTIDGQKTVNGNDFITVLGLKSPKFTYILSY